MTCLTPTSLAVKTPNYFDIPSLDNRHIKVLGVVAYARHVSC